MNSRCSASSVCDSCCMLLTKMSTSTAATFSFLLNRWLSSAKKASAIATTSVRQGTHCPRSSLTRSHARQELVLQSLVPPIPTTVAGRQESAPLRVGPSNGEKSGDADSAPVRTTAETNGDEHAMEHAASHAGSGDGCRTQDAGAAAGAARLISSRDDADADAGNSCRKGV